ncbi:holliday junction resolvase [Acanthamoeba polyphaga mimivirus]|uniref:Holliday junction resolvase n=1 Tax=Acanthamoeba polyphaga mimivirus TaxID=212035 RepID=A0A0G2Y628_MIMIV|nr:holliday junction resolvase [Acanthamoeba polyphaga mimivirus]
MRIISWDVGVIYLAYCVLEYVLSKNKEVIINIIDWNIINLMENNRLVINCCGMKKGNTICDKKASYCLRTPDKKLFGYCKTHLTQYNINWSIQDTEKMFTKISKPDNTCTFLKKTGDFCGKKATYKYKNNKSTNYYCNVHYKSELKNRTKEFSPQPIKNTIVKKYPTAQLQYNLIKKLDKLSKHFAMLGIERVVIENQPSQKNPKMKSIASTLFDYFLIRGFCDKIHNIDIKLVRYMCPSNKLKVNKDNTLEVFKANKDSKKKYKLTKALGIQYTKQLLNNEQEQLDYLSLFEKKDDLCDAYLQGRYYLEFIMDKTDKNYPIIKCQENKFNKPNNDDLQNESCDDSETESSLSWENIKIEISDDQADSYAKKYNKSVMNKSNKSMMNKSKSNKKSNRKSNKRSNKNIITL